MASRPVAYFLTIGTYGTRLHGDPRGTVDEAHSTPGEPFLPPDSMRQQFEMIVMCADATFLSDEQQGFVESTTPGYAQQLGWTCHVVSAARNHVHAVISAEPHGGIVRRLLKRNLNQALSENWPIRAADTWWADGGSVKWIWDQEGLGRAMEYVSDQRRQEQALRARENAG